MSNHPHIYMGKCRYINLVYLQAHTFKNPPYGASMDFEISRLPVIAEFLSDFPFNRFSVVDSFTIRLIQVLWGVEICELLPYSLKGFKHVSHAMQRSGKNFLTTKLKNGKKRKKTKIRERDR